jgi:hypothetical protein
MTFKDVQMEVMLTWPISQLRQRIQDHFELPGLPKMFSSQCVISDRLHDEGGRVGRVEDYFVHGASVHIITSREHRAIMRWWWKILTPTPPTSPYPISSSSSPER